MEASKCPVNHDVLLTARREPDNVFCPALELVATRDSGVLPEVSGFDPNYGEFTGLGITRYEEVRAALNHPASRMGPDPSAVPGSLIAQPGFFMFSDGSDHNGYRRMIAPHFSVRRVARYTDRIESIVNKLLDEMESKGNAGDLIRDFASPLPTQVICEILGVPYAERHEFGRWSEVALGRDTEPADAVAAITNLRSYLFELVSRQRAQPDDCLIGGLISDQGKELDDEVLVGIAMIVLLAGHSTTTGGIVFGTAALLDRPEQLAMVRGDESESVMPGAVEEIIRYATLVQPHYRTMTEDTQIGEHTLEAGDNIVVSLLAANFDKALVGDNPDLDITRAPLPHVGFGYGPHQCPGQHLGRLQIKIAIPALLKRFPNLKFLRPLEELPRRDNDSVRSVVEVPVTW